MKSFLVVIALIGCSLADEKAARAINLGPSAGVEGRVERVIRPRVHVVEHAAQQIVQPGVQIHDAVVKTIVQPTVQAHEAVVKSSPHAHPVVEIISMNSDSTYDGNFKYEFAADNGIQYGAAGSVKPIEGKEYPAQVISGSYSYNTPDGATIITKWYADETGFHAEGDHLPVAPPVPEEIQKAVDYLRSLPPKPEDHKWD